MSADWYIRAAEFPSKTQAKKHYKEIQTLFYRHRASNLLGGNIELPGEEVKYVVVAILNTQPPNYITSEIERILKKGTNIELNVDVKRELQIQWGIMAQTQGWQEYHSH